MTTIEMVDYLDKCASTAQIYSDAIAETYNQIAQRLGELDKQLSEMQPLYPKGQVIGSCVCGSWPGGNCLKCEWVPSKDNDAKEST